MPFLTRLRAHGGNALHACRVAVGGVLLAPFSHDWRAKLEACHIATGHPFLTRETDLSDFLDPELDMVTVGPLVSRHANVSEGELLAIVAFTAEVRPRAVFEIGTYDGRTTLAMSRNLAPGGQIYTLNLSPDGTHDGVPEDDAQLARVVRSGERFLGKPEAARITQLWGDSTRFDYAEFVGRMDLVFIDGAHTADFVRADTATARRLVREEGGLVLWHDATRYGVAEYLDTAVRQDGLPLRVVRGTTVGVCAIEGGKWVDAVDWLKMRHLRRRQGATANVPTAGVRRG